jgi:hypothetical protein
VSDNPARGEAQGRIVLAAYERHENGPQTGVEAQKSNATLIPGRSLLQIASFSNRRSVTPTKINRGGREATNDTWARTGRNAVKS